MYAHGVEAANEFLRKLMTILIHFIATYFIYFYSNSSHTLHWILHTFYAFFIISQLGLLDVLIGRKGIIVVGLISNITMFVQYGTV